MNNRYYNTEIANNGVNARYGQTNAGYVVMSVFGALILCFGLYFGLAGRQNSDWFPTEALVVSQQAHAVNYQYTVDGKTFISNSISVLTPLDHYFRSFYKNGLDSNLGALSPSWDNRGAYQDAKTLTVYYDPMHPKNAVIDRGAPVLAFVAMLIGAIIFVPSFLALITGAKDTFVLGEPTGRGRNWTL